MKRIALIVLFVAAAACSDRVQPVETAMPVLTTLELTLSRSTIGRGQTSIGTPTGRDQYGAVIATGPVTWTSSAPSVASVTSTGVVLAVSGGSATITAAAGGKTARADITVLPIAARIVFVTAPPSPAANRKAFAPVLQLVDAQGTPVAERGVSVFVSQAGGGSLIGANVASSDEFGAVRFSEMYLSGAAGTRVLSFSSNELQALQVNVSLVAGDAAQIVENAGNHQFAPAGTTLPVAPSVRVTDVDGNGVAGVPITYVVSQGGGSITGASTTSNAAGIATVGSWTLGTVGMNMLFVRVTDRQIFQSLDATATRAAVRSSMPTAALLPR